MKYRYLDVLFVCCFDIFINRRRGENFTISPEYRDREFRRRPGNRQRNDGGSRKLGEGRVLCPSNVASLCTIPLGTLEVWSFCNQPELSQSPLYCSFLKVRKKILIKSNIGKCNLNIIRKFFIRKKRRMKWRAARQTTIKTIEVLEWMFFIQFLP